MANKIKEFVDNVKFALYLDDETLKENARKKAMLDRTVGLMINPELADSLIPEDVKDFNNEVNEKLGTGSPSLKPNIGPAFEAPTFEEIVKQTELEPEEQFFDEIVN